MVSLADHFVTCLFHFSASSITLCGFYYCCAGILKKKEIKNCVDAFSAADIVYHKKPIFSSRADKSASCNLIECLLLINDVTSGDKKVSCHFGAAQRKWKINVLLNNNLWKPVFPTRVLNLPLNSLGSLPDALQSMKLLLPNRN